MYFGRENKTGLVLFYGVCVESIATRSVHGKYMLSFEHVTEFGRSKQYIEKHNDS